METDMQMLRACMKYHNWTQEDVSRALGMVRSTFYLHMKDGDFTISQIHKMMEYIPLTMDDVSRIFFATKKRGHREGPDACDGLKEEVVAWN